MSTPDTSSPVWTAAAERVRQVASEGTPADVLNRVIEAEYERDLNAAAQELRERLDWSRA